MLADVVSQFKIEGRFIEAGPVDRGHINETYRSIWETPQGARAYIHQRINQAVFQDVPGLMRNILRVTEHLAKRQAEGRVGPEDRFLRLIPTCGGGSYWQGPDGACWRTFNCIENAESFDVCPSTAHAKEAALTFGRFLNYLSDLDPKTLIEPIARFQDTGLRYEQLDAAISRDTRARSASVRADLDFAIGERSFGMAIVDALRSGKVPLRTSHADPKVNNVLFSRATGRGICVVDLDTCMPGTFLYDFGDLIRSASVPAAEDERDLGKVFMSQDYFRALTEGFVSSLGTVLTESEIELLPAAPRIVALTLGVRFLTDHLNGDVYFRIHREGQNLDRARAQFQIARSMQQQEEFMRTVVHAARSSVSA
jgi:hypothetical protein